MRHSTDKNSSFKIQKSVSLTRSGRGQQVETCEGGLARERRVTGAGVPQQCRLLRLCTGQRLLAFESGNRKISNDLQFWKSVSLKEQKLKMNFCSRYL